MDIFRTRTFERDFTELPRSVQDRFEIKLGFFLIDPFHPSLHTKKIQGSRNIWEARITKQYRFTFNLEDHSCIMRRIGTHDILRTP